MPNEHGCGASAPLKEAQVMAEHSFELIKLAVDGNVAILTFNHPEVMNAVSIPMLDGLKAAFDFLEGEGRGVRCLVLTGEGRAFCTGANLQNRADPSTNTPAPGAVLETHYHPLLRRMRLLPFPIISAVNGPAAGVGMSIALSCDLILAARSAYFLQAFRRIGLVPDGGSTWLLPRLIGRARAMELSLLGERLPAETALQWGLINRVYDDAALMGEARTFAKNLADGPTRALGLIRQLYWDSLERSYEDQLNAERQTQKTVAQSEDFREGIKAFAEKRPAKFTGR
jgi:2-(1,2-epoxy-1,2-dihydrophenyl)acetyl-CoA isomerase